MTQRKRRPAGVKPNSELQNHIRYRMRLEENLNEEMFAEKMMLVRHRVIGIFNKAIDPHTRRGAGGNILLGVGPERRQLGVHILERFGARAVIRLDDLHPRYRALTDYWRRLVIAKIVAELVERQITLMIEESDLWWLDNCGGIWEISQSVADEYVIYRSRIAAYYGETVNTRKAQPYRDERAHHGRPSKQGRRRDHELRQAPGLSISTARYGI